MAAGVFHNDITQQHTEENKIMKINLSNRNCFLVYFHKQKFAP